MTKHPILFLSLLMAAGCTDGGGSFFDVNFDRLEVQDVSFEDVEADFVFRVENRTPLGFQIARFDYALAFEEVEWLSGDDPEGLALHADNYSEISLPVHVVFANLFDLVEATKGKDTIDFGLAGDFGIELSQDTILTNLGDDDPEDTTEAGDGTSADAEEGEDSGAPTPHAVGDVIDIPYDAGGQFPALRRPKFSFKRLDVGSFDWERLVVPVKLKLDVENELGSSLFLTGFDYDFQIEGVSVASGLIEDLGEVLGADAAASTSDTGTATTVLTVPINVDLKGLGESIIQVLSGDGDGRLNVGLDATTDVDTPFGVVTLSLDETGDVSVQ